jgi:O-antigen ligase
MTTLGSYSASYFVRERLLQVIGLTLLAFMIPVATLSRNLLGEAGTVILGGVLFSGTFVIVARSALIHTIPKRLPNVIIAAVPVLLIYTVSTLLHFEISALTNLMQLILVTGFAIGFSLIPWNKASLKPLFWVFSLLLGGHVLWWIASGAPRTFRGFILHSNGLGLFAFLLSFVPLAIFMLTHRSRAIKYIAFFSVTSSIILLLATTSRASWLAAGIVLIVYILWPILIKSRLLFHLSFFTILVSAIVATWGYIIAPNYAWGLRLQELSLAYTGKNLFSGRQRFWGELVSTIELQPWFGYGAGAIAQTFTGFDWSAHNLYFQVLLQVGVIGLGGLILMLWGIWREFWQGRHNKIVRLSASYFLSILVHQVFEVSLTQNSLANGFLIWLIIAIGLSYSWRSSQ